MPINKAKVSEVSQEKILNLITDLNSKASIANPVFTNPPVLPSQGIKFADGFQTKEGVISRTPIIRKTSAYTLTTVNERDCLIEMNSTLPIVLTIPTDQEVDFPIGSSLDILQANSGQVTITSSPITISTFGSGGSSSGITLNL